MKLAELQNAMIDSLVAEGANLEEYKDLKILRYENRERPCLKVYRGKGSKAIASYYYSSPESREESVAGYKSGADSREAYKAERKAAKAAVTNEAVEVGSVWYSSWGYEQTNIDFYKVVEKFGTKGLMFVEIGSKVEVREFEDRGVCVADPENVTGEPFKKLMGGNEWISLTSYSSLSPYDGRELYWSSYH